MPEYTDRELDGFACIVCGGEEGEMVPVERGPRGQLFAHRECPGEAVFGESPDSL